MSPSKKEGSPLKIRDFTIMVPKPLGYSGRIFEPFFDNKEAESIKTKNVEIDTMTSSMWPFLKTFINKMMYNTDILFGRPNVLQSFNYVKYLYSISRIELNDDMILKQLTDISLELQSKVDLSFDKILGLAKHSSLWFILLEIMNQYNLLLKSFQNNFITFNSNINSAKNICTDVPLENCNKTPLCTSNATNMAQEIRTYIIKSSNYLFVDSTTLFNYYLYISINGLAQLVNRRKNTLDLQEADAIIKRLEPLQKIIPNNLKTFQKKISDKYWALTTKASWGSSYNLINPNQKLTISQLQDIIAELNDKYKLPSRKVSNEVKQFFPLLQKIFHDLIQLPFTQRICTQFPINDPIDVKIKLVKIIPFKYCNEPCSTIDSIDNTRFDILSPKQQSLIKKLIRLFIFETFTEFIPNKQQMCNYPFPQQWIDSLEACNVQNPELIKILTECDETLKRHAEQFFKNFQYYSRSFNEHTPSRSKDYKPIVHPKHLYQFLLSLSNVGKECFDVVYANNEAWQALQQNGYVPKGVLAQVCLDTKRPGMCPLHNHKPTARPRTRAPIPPPALPALPASTEVFGNDFSEELDPDPILPLKEPIYAQVVKKSKTIKKPPPIPPPIPPKIPAKNPPQVPVRTTSLRTVHGESLRGQRYAAPIEEQARMPSAFTSKKSPPKQPELTAFQRLQQEWRQKNQSQTTVKRSPPKFKTTRTAALRSSAVQGKIEAYEQAQEARAKRTQKQRPVPAPRTNKTRAAGGAKARTRKRHHGRRQGRRL